MLPKAAFIGWRLPTRALINSRQLPGYTVNEPIWGNWASDHLGNGGGQATTALKSGTMLSVELSVNRGVSTRTTAHALPQVKLHVGQGQEVMIVA
jgi:hypothetical protein